MIKEKTKETWIVRCHCCAHIKFPLIYYISKWNPIEKTLGTAPITNTIAKFPRHHIVSSSFLRTGIRLRESSSSLGGPFSSPVLLVLKCRYKKRSVFFFERLPFEWNFISGNSGKSEKKVILERLTWEQAPGEAGKKLGSEASRRARKKIRRTKRAQRGRGGFLPRPLSARSARPRPHSTSSTLNPTGSLLTGYRKV